MKLFLNRLNFFLILITVIISIGYFIYLLETEQWIKLVKVSIYGSMGILISHYEVLEAIVWTWKKKCKSPKKD